LANALDVFEGWCNCSREVTSVSQKNRHGHLSANCGRLQTASFVAKI